MNSALLSEFEKIHEIEVPKALIQEQSQSIRANTEQRLMQQGMPENEVAEYHKKWETNYLEDAKKGVKTSFLVEALAKKEDLYPKPEDITEYFAELSDKTNIAIDKIKGYYEGPEKQNELEFKLMEEKVLKFLKDNATIEK